MPNRAFLLPCCAFLTCLAAPAATTLTVNNQTGQTLAVTRVWSPWRPEPDDGPMRFPFFQRWIRPGTTATYHLQLPGKDLESEITIRRLPQDGVVAFEHMTIKALDPCDAAYGQEPEPEPEAPAIKSKL